ncbi:DoxX family protein [Gramella sp. MAR_2010_147]|uniref:DoxX family protein n=1 Tax=Gramella sp. MAR_2010_147 TaxID=1250205 RepID=UPI001E428BBD|nr:DoxX family protein [Gramella sp. MAR_2010_147]
MNLRNVDLGILIFRIAIATLMLTHGYPKLIDFFGSDELKFADPIGLGEEISYTLVVFAEFVCSVFIVLGFLTRFAAIPLIITMAVAAFIVHVPDGFMKQELPILYMFGFILLAFTGGGKYSLDFYINKNKK